MNKLREHFSLWMLTFLTFSVAPYSYAESTIPTVKEIKNGLDSTEKTTQRHFALYLSNSSANDPEIFNLYQQLLESDSDWGKALSATKIIENKEQIYRAHFLLRKYVHEKNEVVRRAVIYSLGREPMEGDRAVLLVALKDKDQFVRGLAVEGLGNFKVLTSRNISEIKKLLNDPEFWVRKITRLVLFERE